MLTFAFVSSTARAYMACNISLICESSAHRLKIASAETRQIKSAYKIAREDFEIDDVCFKIIGKNATLAQPWLSRNVLVPSNISRMRRHGVRSDLAHPLKMLPKQPSMCETMALLHKDTLPTPIKSDLTELIAHSEEHSDAPSRLDDASMDQRFSMKDAILICTWFFEGVDAVSYTHLTLPTILRV